MRTLDRRLPPAHTTAHTGRVRRSPNPACREPAHKNQDPLQSRFYGAPGRVSSLEGLSEVMANLPPHSRLRKITCAAPQLSMTNSGRL